MHNQESNVDPHLEALLLEGLETGGEDIELNQTFWDSLRAEVRALIERHSSNPPRFRPTPERRN